MQSLNKSLKSAAIYKNLRQLDRNLRKTVKRFFLRRKLHKNTPIFIYQMGKVASSSIYHSLYKQYNGAVGAGHIVSSHHWRAELLLNWAKAGKPIKIISPVREPIGKNVSEFFELFGLYTDKTFKDSNFSTEELMQLYFKNYPHEHPLTWFDEHIKKHFNIDVFASPFPESGIATYVAKNVSLLVFKVDISDEMKEKAIRSFVNLPSFKLNNVNIGNKKPYHSTYRQFIDAFSATENYLAKFENSKYFNHFYSEDEKTKIMSKWRKGK